MSINATFVLMPKTSSYINNFSGTRKNKIRFSWKRTCMEAEPVLQSADESTYSPFWFRALASDAAHVFTAPLNGEGVGHRTQRMQLQSQTAI
jgi:hypothetical protein